MMRNLLKLLLIAPILFFSCDRENAPAPEGCPESGRCRYEFFEQAALVSYMVDSTIAGIHIEAGNQLVFRYQYVKEDDPHIADDELTRYIMFQAPAQIDSFHYTNEALEGQHASLVNLCFCAGNFFSIHQGDIRGKKINSRQWEVSGEVKPDSTYAGGNAETYHFKAIFERAPLPE